MQHPTLLVLIIFMSLTACAPATAIPTETPTTTATATHTPTQTPTPILEPWMQSLPENVVSVEVDGEQIFGLDSQGSQVMEYSLESGKWVEIEKTLTIDALLAGHWRGYIFDQAPEGHFEMKDAEGKVVPEIKC